MAGCADIPKQFGYPHLEYCVYIYIYVKETHTHMDLGNSIIALSLQFKQSSFMQTPTVFILKHLPGGEFVVRVSLHI